ncbi:MAG: YHS domain-containing protein [Verrucomicrobiales bacterium]|jgi:YHS domain-containing protein
MCIKKYLMMFILLMGWVGNAAAVKPINTTLMGGLAIKGCDPVAYFTRKAPVKGSSDYSFEWQSATWRFASQANLDLFKAAPATYAPQYGGYCAWAVSQNDTAKIDPEQWTVFDGKLYLNYNAKIQKKWLANRDACIKDADANWPILIQ